MVRFVDLTHFYWTCDDDKSLMPPCCAFVDTVTDKFVDVDGSHVFFCDEDVDAIPHEGLRERCRGLMPDGFFQVAPRLQKPETVEVGQRWRKGSLTFDVCMVDDPRSWREERAWFSGGDGSEATATMLHDDRWEFLGYATDVA